MSQTLSVQLQPTQRGSTLFEKSLREGRFYRFLSRITHQRAQLLELNRELSEAGAGNSSYIGTCPVDIQLIRGTEGKSGEFDGQFHPIRESSRFRWLSILIERLRGHDLPPVELVELNGIYYVRDGHHRVSVARCLGQAYIDAEVTKIIPTRRIN